MKKFSILIACGALAAGAGLTQAQAQNGPSFVGNSGFAAPWDAINPGAGYGLNSTVPGAQGATVGDTTVNVSSQEYDGPIFQGRAAASAPPPADETAAPVYEGRAANYGASALPMDRTAAPFEPSGGPGPDSVLPGRSVPPMDVSDSPSEP